MSNSKFIIGLGTTLPSTRILKPPGGGSNNLFGLQDRQYERMRYVNINKFQNGTLPYTQEKSFDNDTRTYGDAISKHGNSISNKKFENIAEKNILGSDKDVSFPDVPTDALSGAKNKIRSTESNKKSVNSLLKNENQFENDSEYGYNLKKAEAKENLLENRGKLNLTEEIYNNMTVIKSSPNLQIDALNEKETKASKSNNDMAFNKEKISSPIHKPDQESLAKYTDIENSMFNKNKSKTTKRSKGTSKNIQYPEIYSKSKKNLPEGKVQYSRNPITGALTKVYKKAAWKPLMSDLDCKNSNDYVLAKGLVVNLKREKVYVRRNPITGEGTRDDTNHYKFAPRGIRVIQPPGGISCLKIM